MSLDDLLLAGSTRRAVDNFLKDPAHAVLLIGAKGSGKSALATNLAAELLEITPEKLNGYPHFIKLTKPEGKQDIPIESVRQLIASLSLSIPSTKKISRVVLIQDAHNLNTQSQNALLKTLEEPDGHTVFILTTHTIDGLLTTIASRAQKISVLPVNLKEATDFYKDRFSDQQIESAWQLSQAAAGLMDLTLRQETSSSLAAELESAKAILFQSSYERLVTFDSLTKDKDQFAAILQALNRIISVLQKSAAGKQANKQAASLLKFRKLVYSAQSDLSANVAPRLIAIDLALNLPRLV